MAGACDNFAGRARARITIQPRTEAADNYGGQTITWTTSNISAWAIMEPQSGREVFAQGQEQSRVDMKVTIRYQSTINSTAIAGKYRISYDSRIFTVLAIKNLDEDMKREGKAYQVLSCVENAPESS